MNRKDAARSMPMLRAPRVLLALWFAGCLCAVPAFAQSEPPQQPEHAGMPGGDHLPVVIRGFADVDFGTTDDRASGDGFSLGQFVLHMAAPLGRKVSFFAETSFTPRSNAFSVELERLSVRYDVDDRLKISMGRYHTPINYWNTAFHHGLWLQTTIRRPEMIQFGGVFQPVHFVGLLAEGLVSSPTLGLSYNVGVGNGRGALIGRAGDAGDVNRNRAWLGKLYVRPARLYGLEAGGAVYHDLITAAGTPEVREVISSAYIALSRETPEIIAEFTNVNHRDPVADRAYTSRAFYVQAAYRPPSLAQWKPYYRFERMFGVDGEPVFGNVDLTISTAGVRYELTDVVAVKLEYRNSRRLDTPRSNGVFVQVAFVF